MRSCARLVLMAAVAAGCGGETWSPPDTDGWGGQLRIAVPGGGTVLGFVPGVSTPVISCPASLCSASVRYGREVRLEATPLTGRTFLGWSDAAGTLCAGAGTICTITSGLDVDLTASFGPPSAAWSHAYGGEEANNYVGDVVASIDGVVAAHGDGYGRGTAWVTGILADGTMDWSIFLGDAFSTSVAVSSGGVVVGGQHISETPRIGGLDLPVYGGRDAFVAQLDDRGGVSWVRAIGGPGSDGVAAVAGGSLAAMVAVTYDEAFAVDAQIAPAPAGQDVALVGFGGTGIASSLSAFGSDGDDVVVALERASDDSLWLLVHSDGPLRWSGGSLDGSGHALLHLNATGESVLSAERFGGEIDPLRPAAFAGALASTPDGDLYVAVTFAGTLAIDGAVYASAGQADFVVARRSAAGGYAWAHQFGGELEDGANDLALTSVSLVVVGRFAGRTTLNGPETLTARAFAIGEGDAPDLFVLHLEPTTGATRSAIHYGGVQRQTSGAAAAAIGTRGVAVGGSTGGSIDFGHGALLAGDRTAFVVRFDE